MLSKAREIAGDEGIDFIITGEVIGQRPKSQLKWTMPVIARESGADDRVLRPLSALNLAPTLQEREGGVNRDELYGFSGRSRKLEIELAGIFGLWEIRPPWERGVV